jgi:probable HAF family extracellular repeat protein
MHSTQGALTMLRTLVHILLGAMLGAVLISSAVAAPAPSYNFFSVANPNDTAFTQLLGINNSSTIAGYWGDGAVVPNHGFTLVLPNSFTPENFPMAAQTQVIGINNTGWTDGFYVDQGGVTHGFTFNAGTYTTVDAPATAFNQLLGINDGLTAVGYSSTDPTGMTLQMSFKESGGTFSYITGFPVGTGNNQAVGINNAGIAVGFYQDSTGAFHGYIAPGTTANSFDVSFAGAMGTQAFGINNNGEIVGDYADSTGTMHGFVFIGGTFYTVDDPLGVPGSTIINGVNDLGQLVGFYADANDNVIGFVATPTPEPSSLVLVGSGMLAGLGFLRRKLIG